MTNEEPSESRQVYGCPECGTIMLAAGRVTSAPQPEPTPIRKVIDWWLKYGVAIGFAIWIVLLIVLIVQAVAK